MTRQRKKINTDEIWDLLGEVTATLIWLEKYQNGEISNPTDRQVTYAHTLLKKFKDSAAEHIKKPNHEFDKSSDRWRIRLAQNIFEALDEHPKMFRDLDDNAFIEKFKLLIKSIYMAFTLEGLPILDKDLLLMHFTNAEHISSDLVSAKSEQILAFKKSKRNGTEILVLIAELTNVTTKTVRTWLKLNLGSVDYQLRREELFEQLIRRFSSLPSKYQNLAIRNLNLISDQHLKDLHKIAEEQKIVFWPGFAALFPLPRKAKSKGSGKTAQSLSPGLVAGRQNRQFS